MSRNLHFVSENLHAAVAEPTPAVIDAADLVVHQDASAAPARCSARPDAASESL
jgi:hypothetical protein